MDPAVSMVSTSYLSFELRLYLIIKALNDCQLACVVHLNRPCSITHDDTYMNGCFSCFICYC